MRLQEGEKVLHELRPSRRLVGFWAIGALIPSLIVAFALFMIVLVASDGNAISVVAGLVVGLGGGGVIFAVAVVYASILRRTYVYTITNQRLLFKGGVLWRRERSVPYHKVTDVEQSQIIFERLFGIWRLKIYTPGTGQMAPELQYVGLLDTEAPAAAINDVLRGYRATGE